MTVNSLSPRAPGRFVRLGVVVAICVAMAAVVGCSGGPKRPATVKVSGKVTMNGTPIPGATVSFQSTAPGGRAAVGITDEAGQYTLTTFSAGDGAVAGEYGVAISKTETVAAAASSSANSDDYVPPEGLKEPPPAKSLIPPRFNNTRDSGLRASVGSGSNTFDFDLAQ